MSVVDYLKKFINEVVAMGTNPQFKLYQQRQRADEEFQKLLRNRTPDQAAALLSCMAVNLLSAIDQERMGGNPHAEGTLKQMLAMAGINVQQDILYGKEIPASIRQHWQMMGMDPNSENEVAEFLKKYNTLFASKQGLDDFVKKIDDSYKLNANQQEKPAPESKKLR